jgi:acylglycerol lipase
VQADGSGRFVPPIGKVRGSIPLSSTPLVHGRATARFAIDVLAQMDRVASAATRVAVPLLVVHGDADLINPLSASRQVVDLVQSATLRTCPGVYHGLEDEAEGPAIMADVIAWIDRTLRGEKSDTKGLPG